MEILEIELSKITKIFSVRKLNSAYVSFLANEIKTIGYQKANPISITNSDLVWDGLHRINAAKEAGLKTIFAVMETPDNIRRAAHDRNRASQNALPETFADHAEEIWGMLSTGMTQQQVADELGWSRTKVSDHARLEGLCPNVWNTIDAHIQNIASQSRTDGASHIDAFASFSEGLLRNILDLTEYHQLEIVNGITNGKIGKTQVKSKALMFRDRESFIEYALDNLISNERIYHDNRSTSVTISVRTYLTRASRQERLC